MLAHAAEEQSASGETNVRATISPREIPLEETCARSRLSGSVAALAGAGAQGVSHGRVHCPSAAHQAYPADV